VSDNDRVGRALSRQSTVWAGILVGAALVVGIAALVDATEGDANRATPALALVVPVLIVAIVGGRVAALSTAVVAAVALNLVFVPPHWTLKINSLDDGVALAVFVVVALVVGTLVAREVQRRRAAEQRRAEIEALYRQYEVVVDERERLMDESHRLDLLEKIDNERRALLRSVSHDLRTPLAAIRAATSDMRDGAGYDEATRDELLDIVGDEAERLDRLVANLLSLSRIEAGAFQPDRQAVALDELVTDRVHRLARVFRHVRVEQNLSPDLPLLDADYSQLDQVVTNLLENAARHSPTDAVITIGARVADEEAGVSVVGGSVAGASVAGGSVVEVSVADRGPGLDMDLRHELFEPFRRGPGSRSSGIGLAICRAIVDAHGGHIDGSNRPGGGAVFTFTMPVRHDPLPADGLRVNGWRTDNGHTDGGQTGGVPTDDVPLGRD
jgi:K+-sensing histidine kinase KdpD